MTKLHQSEEFLRKAIEQGLTSRDISKEFNVSYKLIEIYLRKYGIEHTSMVPAASQLTANSQLTKMTKIRIICLCV